MEWTENSIVDYLRKKAKRGKISVKIIKEDKNGPTLNQIIKIFGTWNNALIAASIKINRVEKYSEQYLITVLKIFFKENNRNPKYREFTPEKGYPHFSVYRERFGNWNKALQKANLFVKKKNSNDELSELLKQAFKKNKKNMIEISLIIYLLGNVFYVPVLALLQML